MAQAIFSVKMDDDLTAVSKATSASVEQLTKDVTGLGNAFAKANTGNLTVGLKEARQLFAASAGNVKLFKASLKDAGVSALDTSLLVGKLSNELRQSRREALGIGTGFWERIFNPRAIWVMSHSLNVLSKGFAGVKMVATPLFGALQSGAELLYKGGESMFGEVIRAAQFRQNSLVAIASEMEGNEAERMRQAKDLFAYAQKTAKETPLDTENVIAGIRDLKVAKFTTSESKLLYRLVADQASKHLSDPGYDKQVISAFARVQGRGVATGEDFESMRVAGFNAKEIAMSLAGTHPDLFPEAKKKFVVSEEEGLKYIKEVLGKGKIGSRTFINAVIAAAEKDKPDIGELAKQLGATSLTGAISNVKAAFGDLISSVDIVDWPGIQALIRFLGRISAVLDSNSESGKKFLDTVKAATDALFGGLDRIEQSDINLMVEKLGKGVLFVADTLERAWKWFGEIVTGQKSIGEGAEEMLIDVGVLIGEGIKTGFTTVFGESRKERKLKQETGLSQAGLDLFSTYQHGGDTKAFRADFSGKYQAYLASGNKVPEAKWYQAQEEVTYNAVTEWAAKAGQSVETNTAALAARTSASMQSLGEQAAMSLETGWRGALQQNSPSRVLLDLGKTAAQSLAGGFEDGSDRSLPGSGGSYAPTVNLTIAVNGDSADPASVAQAVRPVIVSELTAVFRRLAQERA